MESLAAFVSVLLLVLLAILLASVVFSLLTRLNKVPMVVGYIFVGIQFVLTVFAYQLSNLLGNISLIVLVVCALLVFVPKSSKPPIHQ